MRQSWRDWQIKTNRVQRRRERSTRDDVGGSRLVGEPLGATRKKVRRKKAKGLRGAKSYVLGSWDLPGDHGAGLRVAGGGGGGTELREAAMARLQAGHGAPAEREEEQRKTWEGEHFTAGLPRQLNSRSNTEATAACQRPAECTLCNTMQPEVGSLYHTALTFRT